MHRFFPAPEGETTPQELAAELRCSEDPPNDRPRVITNFVLSVDGRATLGGVSGPIGSDRDTEMLVALRTRVDAVMIGAGTMRVERYGRVVGDPAKRAAREADGLAPDPLMVIISGRLDLPWDAPLFTCGGGEVLVLTTSDADPPETATPVRLVRYESLVGLGAALGDLRQEGIRSVLCEGGPNLHAQLIQGSLVDELFVTRAPKITGGEGPGLISGLPEAERPLRLEWLAMEPKTGELFARYRTANAG
jgi:riboflavin-specific deaminase-like protein